MRQNATGGQVRPSLPNGPTTNSLPSPSPSLHPIRPHLGPPHRPLCPPQPLANGPVGAGTHGHSDPLPVGGNSSSNNQSGPTATGPNGDVPYLQPAGSGGDAALLPHTCTSTQTQDATPRQALHLNSSQVRLSHSLSFFPFSFFLVRPPVTVILRLLPLASSLSLSKEMDMDIILFYPTDLLGCVVFQKDEEIIEKNPSSGFLKPSVKSLP